MDDISLMPLAGINNVAEDEAMKRGGDSARVYLRDAVNVDITAAGRASVRTGERRVSTVRYRDVWQSPLHRDTFGTLDGQWVKIDPTNWTHAVLAAVGEGAAHVVLNSLVCVAGPAGLFTFDGIAARRLTLDTPPAPLLTAGAGSLEPGTYGAAVAWLRGAQESATSELATVEVGASGALEVALPIWLDPTLTGARLYLTRRDGGELLRAGDWPAGTATIHLPLLPQLGAAAQFRHLSPMPTGQFLAQWRGRLLTARGNVLRWSEALAYHLHNERHGFVQMPQRITFVQPVDAGVWVGQVDHVVFLRGSAPDEFSVERKGGRAPVPGSAVLAPPDALGGDLTAGGTEAAIWLADNGYVVGTAAGALVELQAGVMKGIAARAGTSVVFGRRLLTAVA
ncbi:hypothetical protein [uncultured Variovorax sp.]|uniref:hypothetical protein n=1 Tax=uncultured Variovorax sp. TaxID=114708 RepID=UPI0025F6D722|nr:hypothetical protein [uncultured Variovorax sp.]